MAEKDAQVVAEEELEEVDLGSMNQGLSQLVQVWQKKKNQSWYYYWKNSKMSLHETTVKCQG